MEKIALGNYPTPVFDVSHVLKTQNCSSKLWIKRDDYSGIELSGNKTRKLQYALAEAKSQGAKVVITAGAIQSNHCRATAAACKALGLDAHLMLFGKKESKFGGNLLIDQILGAHIEYIPIEDYARYLKIMSEIVISYAQKGLKAYPIPIGASYGIGNFGYVDAYSEIIDWQLKTKSKIDSIVCGVGSGGTYAGLVLGKYLENENSSLKNTEIVGISVSLSEKTLKEKIIKLLEESIQYKDLLKKLKPKFNATELLDFAKENIKILEGFQGEGYAIPFDKADEMSLWMAQKTGIIFDPVYTGKAFYGLMRAHKKGLIGPNVMFIHTGGLFGTMGTSL